MLAKALSALLAAAALAGAVLYAQNQAEKGKKPKPVFDTSKSGTPTPIEEKPAKPPAASLDPNEVQPGGEPTAEQAGNPAEKPQKKKKQKKIMPSSKAAFPD